MKHNRFLCYLSKAIVGGFAGLVILSMAAAVIVGGYAITQASGSEIKQGLLIVLGLGSTIAVLSWAIKHSERC